MNELQKKLARRRSLNGEQFAAQEISCDAEGTATPPARDSPKHFNTKGTPPQFPDSAKTSKASELQSKLARRRDLNGEAGAGAANPVESTIPAPTLGPENVVPAFKVMKRADSNASTASASQSRTSSLADAEGPAWLNDFASSVQSKEPFHDNHVQSHDSLQVEAPLTPHIVHDAAVAASIVEAEQTTEDTSSAQAAQEEAPASPTSPTADNSDPLPEPSETPEGYKADTEESTATEPDTTVKNTLIEVPASAVEENNTAISDPAPEDNISVVQAPLTEKPQEGEGSVGTSPEEADAALMVPALHDVPSRTASPSAQQVEEETPGIQQSSAVVDSDAPAVTAAAASATEQTEGPRLSLQSEVDTDAAKTEKDGEVNHQEEKGNTTPPAQSNATDTKKSDQSPQRTRGGWSPKRTTTTTVPAATASLPTVDTGNIATTQPGSGGNPTYLRANTNPGTAPAGTFSPLRRTNSFAGVNPTPTHQPTPVRKTSWYPGKFLIEGPAGWGSKNSTPMMKMNPDQARSHYADLLSSSAKDVPKGAALSPKNGSQVSPKMKEMSRQEQRQEDLRVAHIPESVAAGTSDDIIDMVLQLSRENSQLKKEVAHLKAKLAHQQVLLDAFKGASIEEVTSDGAESATSRSTHNAAEHKEIDEGAGVAKGQSGSHITHAADAAESHSHSHMLAQVDGEQTERTSLTETPLSPNASATKARASRRFGARNYYSSFQSEESEDGLFGADEPAEEVGRNNKYKSLTFEDLGDLSDSGVANAHRNKSASDDASLVGSLEDHSLDKLLRSATGSSSKDRDSVGRALIGEKYLVQSFRSTSAHTTKRGADAQGEGSDADAKGDWQTRFGHLGLIAADSVHGDAHGGEETNNTKPKQLFNEEADAKARQRAAAAQAREAVSAIIISFLCTVIAYFCQPTIACSTILTLLQFTVRCHFL